MSEEELPDVTSFEVVVNAIERANLEREADNPNWIYEVLDLRHSLTQRQRTQPIGELICLKEEVEEDDK